MAHRALEDTLTDADKVARVKEHLAQTTGADKWFRHPLFKGLTYTSGVQFVAETCEAHWLIDLIFSHQLSLKVRRETFQVWELLAPAKDGGAWVITAWDDTPRLPSSHKLARQVIGYSDFPVGLSPFKLWVEHGTLLLPEEH